jgi:hypothetical protein
MRLAEYFMKNRNLPISESAIHLLTLNVNINEKIREYINSLPANVCVVLSTEIINQNARFK